LDDLNLAEGARYIERASMADQKILALDELAGAKAPYFSMILVRPSVIPDPLRRRPLAPGKARGTP
jgi:precorrin-2 methylase